MSSMQSHFNMLLNAFHVSGKELAGLLHIDPSLVSKWKTSKRSLKHNSTYLNSIADYFVSLDSISNYKTIKALLEHNYDAVNYTSATEFSMALKHWLLNSPDLGAGDAELYNFMHRNKKGREHSYLVFCGNVGRREAVLSMLEIAVELPSGQEIWSYSQEPPDWFMEDDTFSQKWTKLNMDFLTKGNNVINVIHPVDRQYKSLAISLFKWLPLHMTGMTRPYYMPQYWEADVKITLFLVKGKLLLFGMTTDAVAKESCTWAFTEPKILNDVFHILQSQFHKSTRLFDKYEPKDHRRFADDLTNMASVNEQQYIFTRFPLINILEPQEISDILLDGGVLPQTIDDCLRACAILREDSVNNGGNFFRYLVLPSQISHLLRQKEIPFDTLSLLSGQKICVSNKTFRELLRKMISTIHESENYEIAFVEDTLASSMDGLNIFVKKNASACVFNCRDGDSPSLVLMAHESVVILSLFLYCDHVWTSLLPRSRDKNYVIEQIRVMLDTIFPNDSL